MNLGAPELIIVLVIVVILFGVGRISKISGEMGKSIRAFKDGLKGEEDNNSDKSDQETK
jgi:sec-independent protein translocase protein TatA